MDEPYDSSDFSPCNRCIFEALKRRKKGHKVEARPDPWPGAPKGVRVYVDGKKCEIWFGELSERCAC